MTMNTKTTLLRGTIALVVLTMIPAGASAHCDAMDGPVVLEAREALVSGDLTPVLKWVQPEHEQEIQRLFRRTREVRAQGPQVREIADQHFLETLVRLHRAGEGAPYTGLKQSVNEGPAVMAVDQALAGAASDDQPIDILIAKITDGIRERVERTIAAREKADASVEAGREYVHRYVDLIHYVKNIEMAAAGQGSEHADEADHAAEADSTNIAHAEPHEH